MSRLQTVLLSISIALFSVLILLFIVPHESGEKGSATFLPKQDSAVLTPVPPPQLRSRAAVLYDFESERLLFDKQGELSIPPASMTKLMTLHLVYEAIEEGKLSRETEVLVGRKADFRSQAPGSSLMFLEEGQRVTVLELMKGLAVPSGNDAAVALARLVSGSVELFVEEMNAEVQRLGLSDIHFVDPAGIESENSVTARSFGRFCLHYIREHPYALEELHSLEDFTYPRRRNLREGEGSSYGPIRQENYNLLVGRHPLVNGLKTGYIEESGYNISITAEAGGRRLLAVILGGPGNSPREGNLSRVIDGSRLISYGLYAFREVTPPVPEPGPVRVWGAEETRLELDVPQPERLVLPVIEAARVESRLRISSRIHAPVEKGAELGKLEIYAGERRLVEYPLVASRAVKEGSLLRRLADRFTLEILSK